MSILHNTRALKVTLYELYPDGLVQKAGRGSLRRLLVCLGFVV